MTTKLEIACELLNEALTMYYKGDSYFACLHLAGGAEELLGKYLTFLEGENSLQSLHAGALKIYSYENDLELREKVMFDLINDSKNSIKHMDNLADRFFNKDIKAEAEIRLDMAVSNYYNLMAIAKGSETECLKETDLIKRFNNQLKSVVE
jgi:hypothetical protein